MLEVDFKTTTDIDKENQPMDRVNFQQTLECSRFYNKLDLNLSNIDKNQKKTAIFNVFNPGSSSLEVTILKAPSKAGIQVFLGDELSQTITLLPKGKTQCYIFWNPIKFVGKLKDYIVFKTNDGYNMQVNVEGLVYENSLDVKNDKDSFKFNLQSTSTDSSMMMTKTMNSEKKTLIDNNKTKVVSATNNTTTATTTIKKRESLIPVKKNLSTMKPSLPPAKTMKKPTLSEEQEQINPFLQWINLHFSPITSFMQTISQENQQSSSIPTIPSMFSMNHVKNILIEQHGYDYYLSKGLEMYSSHEFQHISNLLSKEINANKLVLRTDRQIFLDIALQSDLYDLLFSYSLPYLILAMEILLNKPKELMDIFIYSFYGELTSEPFALFDKQAIKSMNKYGKKTMLMLKQFIKANFLQIESINNNNNTNMNNTMNKPNGFLHSILSLIVLLDCLYKKDIFSYSISCLFDKNARFKSSQDILIQLCQICIRNEGDIIKHLSNINVDVKVYQTSMDEYAYSFELFDGLLQKTSNTLSNNLTNKGNKPLTYAQYLYQEFSDGIRLVKLYELVTKTSKNMLVNQLRIPAISRMQKIHNLTFFFTLIFSHFQDTFNDVNQLVTTFLDLSHPHFTKKILFIFLRLRKVFMQENEFMVVELDTTNKTTQNNEMFSASLTSSSSSMLFSSLRHSLRTDSYDRPIEVHVRACESLDIPEEELEEEEEEEEAVEEVDDIVEKYFQEFDAPMEPEPMLLEDMIEETNAEEANEDEMLSSDLLIPMEENNIDEEQPLNDMETCENIENIVEEIQETNEIEVEINDNEETSEETNEKQEENEEEKRFLVEKALQEIELLKQQEIEKEEQEKLEFELQLQLQLSREHLMNQSSMKIQSTFRMFSQRKLFRCFKLSVIILQNAFRRRRVLRYYELMIQSKIIVVNFYRKYHKIRKMQQQTKACLVIQHFIRHKKQQKITKASQCIYKCMQTYRARVKFTRFMSGLRRFLAIYRAMKVREKNDAKIQKLLTMIKVSYEKSKCNPQLKIRQQAIGALKIIKTANMIMPLVQACNTLHLCTQLSQEFCEILVLEAQASTILFTLLQTCNRSTPHQRLLRLVLLILLTLSKYDHLLPTICDSKNSVASLLDLMQVFRDKSTVFILSTELLSKLSKHSIKIKEHCLQPLIVKRLIGIHHIMDRKCNMEKKISKHCNTQTIEQAIKKINLQNITSIHKSTDKSDDDTYENSSTIIHCLQSLGQFIDFLNLDI